MVVVLTVLLAVIGVLFVMAARLDEMATTSVVYDKDLDNAVASVVDLISHRLADDIPVAGQLASAGDQAAANVDFWLAPVEPNEPDPNGTPAFYGDDIVRWNHVSDITGRVGPAMLKISTSNKASGLEFVTPDWYARGVLTTWEPDADARHRAPADADGDGVPDSYWIRLGLYNPGLGRFVVPFNTSSRGRPVFAAVRIVDNCGMLNLNAASYIRDPNTWPDLQGRYLCSVDYHRFLRGTDRLDPLLIQAARQGGIRAFLPPPGIDAPDVYHNNALMHIENPGADWNADGLPDYILFDIADELEIRNRFMLTSDCEPRFERKDVSNFTLDAGGGIYSYLAIPRDPSNFGQWVWRIAPNNFDHQSGAYVDPGIPVDYRWKYDRRHVCTFYSFDRNLRMGVYRSTDTSGNPVEPIFPVDALTVSTNFGVWDPATKTYTYNNPQTRMQILKLLYAYRAYFLARNPGWDYKQAASQACQFVANMIDYVDDPKSNDGPFVQQVVDADGDLFDYGSQTNDNPTYINRAIIGQLIKEVSKYLYGRARMIDINAQPRYEFGIGIADQQETRYGYERQPFISEIARYDDPAVDVLYAVELCNPYDTAVKLEGWQLKIGSSVYPFANAMDPVGQVDVPAAAGLPASRNPGRRVLISHVQIVNPDPNQAVAHYELSGMTIPANSVIELQRPDPSVPGQYLTVDSTRPEQAGTINTMNAPDTFRVSKRDDMKWRFAKADSYTTDDNNETLKEANLTGTLNSEPAFQMPVEDRSDPIDTLHDFEMVLSVGNERDPSGAPANTKPVTERIASAVGEGEVRMDVVPVRLPTPPGIPQKTVSPLDYVCFMGRPEGSLPGRININNAPMEVIRAAIRDRADLDTTVDNEALARGIVRHRYNKGLAWPCRRITDLVDYNNPRGIGFDQFAGDPSDDVGDPDMVADFEERDWILSQVANLFTVRSDVFTAYILVRIDRDGPERRMIAIFDRTNVYRDPVSGLPSDKPRLIALHPVPDPR